jgi:ApaG protein
MTEKMVTHDFEVKVDPQYLPDESDPTHNYYFFSYTVTIRNQSSRTAQLMSRHWIITDGFGRTEEVVGDGVVGKQPLLEPGQSFSYTSACPLPTSSGSMEGTYTMQDTQGKTFKITIPQFNLRVVSLLH